MDYELMHEVADYHFNVEDAVDYITAKHEEEAFMDMYYDLFDEEATFDDICMSDDANFEDALYEFIVEDGERSAEYVEFIGWQPDEPQW